MTVPSDQNPYDVGPDGPLYLTTEELADRFRMTASGIRDMRARGEGPLGVVFARRVLYPLPGIEQWEAERLREAVELQARKSRPLASVGSLRTQGSAAPRTRSQPATRRSAHQATPGRPPAASPAANTTRK